MPALVIAIVKRIGSVIDAIDYAPFTAQIVPVMSTGYAPVVRHTGMDQLVQHYAALTAKLEILATIFTVISLRESVNEGVLTVSMVTPATFRVIPTVNLTSVIELLDIASRDVLTIITARSVSSLARRIVHMLFKDTRERAMQ